MGSPASSVLSLMKTVGGTFKHCRRLTILLPTWTPMFDVALSMSGSIVSAVSEVAPDTENSLSKSISMVDVMLSAVIDVSSESDHAAKYIEPVPAILLTAGAGYCAPRVVSKPRGARTRAAKLMNEIQTQSANGAADI